jgi:hypothetical protein
MFALDSPCSTQCSMLQRLVARLTRRPLVPTPQQLQARWLLQSLLAQVPRLRTVHQVQQLRSLAACWLAAPDQRLLDKSLQQQLQQMAKQLRQCPRSTASPTKTGRSTGKRRR